MSIIESLAVLFGILYVVLAVKEIIWCWLSAAINVSLYIYICFSAQLYLETILQVFYLFMAFYGYYSWNKNSKDSSIIKWTLIKHLLIIVLGIVVTILLGYYFLNYTNSKLPYIDSFTTVFAIITTYMVIKKELYNWLYWIVIDIVSVYMYFSRELQLTAFLYVFYATLAIIGYFTWLKNVKNNA